MRLAAPPGVGDRGAARAGFSVDGYLFYWVSHVGTLYKNRMREALKRIDLPLPAWRSLMLLKERGPLTITQLAMLAVIERSALTRVLADMEARGWISRVPAPDDGRSWLVEVTAAGLEPCERGLEIALDVYASATSGLSVEQIEHAIVLMKALARRLGGPEHRLLGE